MSQAAAGDGGGRELGGFVRGLPPEVPPAADGGDQDDQEHEPAYGAFRLSHGKEIKMTDEGRSNANPCAHAGGCRRGR